METSLADLFSQSFNIPIIPENRRYWLVRTKGGDYYQDFVEGNFVAIGYNQISEQIITEALKQKDRCKEFLKVQVEKFYPDETRSGLVSGYIINMMQGIKCSDIIVIPDKDSCNITFGEVDNSPAYFESLENIKQTEFLRKDSNIITCPYFLRRHIIWKKTISKESLDLHLLKAFFSHNTISNIDSYGYTVDRTLYELFIKSNEIHCKLNITTEKSITMSSYLNLMYSIKLITDEFNAFGGNAKCDFDNITVKMQAESPGFSEMISIIPQTGNWAQLLSSNLGFIPPVIIIAFVIVSLTGGKFKFLGFQYETPGLINKIFEWYNAIKKNKTPGIKRFEQAYNQLQKDNEKTQNITPLPIKDDKEESH